MPPAEAVEERLLVELAAHLGRDLDGATLDDALVDDLGLDSLELLIVVECVADTWGVVLPPQLDWSITTVHDICHYIRVLTPDP